MCVCVCVCVCVCGGAVVCTENMKKKKKEKRFVAFEFDGKIPSVLTVKTQDKDSKETVSVTPCLHQP